MELALKDAGIDPDAIDYINAHGTSTPLGDLAETRPSRPPSAPHAQKVCDQLHQEPARPSAWAPAAASRRSSPSLAVNRNLIPPTINLDNPDPECDLDYVPHKARDRKVTYAMSNSFGFGGHNATLLFRKAE